MFNDRWRMTPRMDAGAGSRLAEPPVSTRIQTGSRGLDAGGGAAYKRNSNGLEQFFSHLQGMAGLNILDLSGASQANIGFITNLGHRVYSDDFQQSLEHAFGANGEFYDNQGLQERIDAFLDQSFNFPEAHFDGALLWDGLEFMAPALLRAAVERLHRIIRPGSYLLALFHGDERAATVPLYWYRISDPHTLLLAPRGARKPAQFFNNRAVERIFQSFETVKFFLTRDHLREVIVKR